MATENKKTDAVGPKTSEGVGKATVETPVPPMGDTYKISSEPFNPAKAQLPVLIGKLMEACLYDRSVMQQAKRDLTVWYNAQPLEDRKDMAREFRKTIETAKQITESLYGTAIEVSMNDVG